MQACQSWAPAFDHAHLHQSGNIDFTTAKHRAVIAVPTNAVPSHRICSEPSPDVFSVLASSLSGSLAANIFSQPGTKESEDIAASFGMTSAETGSTIERTQVINLMRESMFRTCERFMNGAIDDDEMTVQTARDQRMMVATLAIEQLTGAVKSKPTVLSTEAAGVVANNAAENIKIFKEAEEKATAADTALKAAEKDKSDKDKALKDLIKDKDDDEFCQKTINPPEGFTADENITKEKCEKALGDIETAKSKVETTKAAKKAADDNLTLIKKLVQQASGITVNAKAGSFQTDSSLTPRSDDHIKNVADTVKAITLAAFNDQSEILFTCQKIIKSGNANDALQKDCAELFKLQFISNVISNNDKGDKASVLLKAAGLSDKEIAKITEEEKQRVASIQALLNSKTEWNKCVSTLRSHKDDSRLTPYISGGMLQRHKLKQDLNDGGTDAAELVNEVCGR